MGAMSILLLSVGAILGITIYRLMLTNKELKGERESLRQKSSTKLGSVPNDNY